jgi:hypothetical protein
VAHVESVAERAVLVAPVADLDQRLQLTQASSDRAPWAG